MDLGVIFPQVELHADASEIRDYAQTIESLGFDFLEVWDHVILADAARLPSGTRYNATTPFHEPIALFGFLAAVTDRITLATGVLVLPQRQTVLVAKQVAELDLLSCGRLRLGVGVGFLPIEYEALGVDFHHRGQIIEEQIDLMRQLWTNKSIEFQGKYHTVGGAGISPLPTAPIPIWMGGRSKIALKRAARVADGWLPAFFGREPDEDIKEAVDELYEFLTESGRSPRDFAIEGRTPLSGSPGEWIACIEQWRVFGATHVAINTMGLGLRELGEHIGLLEALAHELGLERTHLQHSI